MKSVAALALAAALLAPAALPAAAQAAVEVSFIAPDTFTDAYPRAWRAGKDRDRTLRTLKTFIERQAPRYLAPGQDLKIEISDVDLAGRTGLFVNPFDLRLMTAVDSPAVTIRYTLSENGRTLAQTEERVVDLNYQMSINSYANSDPLRYEKAMLKRWLAKRFGAPAS